jgi:hypothetical protein
LVAPFVLWANAGAATKSAAVTSNNFFMGSSLSSWCRVHVNNPTEWMFPSRTVVADADHLPDRQEVEPSDSPLRVFKKSGPSAA